MTTQKLPRLLLTRVQLGEDADGLLTVDLLVSPPATPTLALGVISLPVDAARELSRLIPALLTIAGRGDGK